MNKTANDIINECNKDEQAWVELSKKTNKEKGIKNLLTELYPDNAHFIYELLQNAEDRGATEVKFELFENELRFTHNGELFKEEHFRGIINIGKGTSAKDIDKIGKFGVGFKAVFAYTSTPKIYSGEYNFQISDLVVPSVIESIIPNSLETLMIFPFNHKHSDKTKEKTKEKAYKEIKDGLKKIEDNVLLFLIHIKKLSYSIDNENYILKREVDKDDDIIIHIENSKNNSISKWLRFKKYVPRKDKLYVSVAFRLETDKHTKQEYIKRINGQVSIFFPAEKERSNLKFHIHAPFASTVARDSIKDLEENNELRDLISKLLLDVLRYVKKHDLLDYNFLTCMPNVGDNLSDFYLPIQKSLIDYFNNEEFLFVDEQEYHIASECILLKGSHVKNKDILNIRFVRKLMSFDTKKGKWYFLDEKLVNSNRAEEFICSLEIRLFNVPIFFEILNKLSNDSTDNINEIFQEQSDEWFRMFYAFCFNVYRDKGDFLKKFILLSTGLLNIDNKNCYFFEKEIDNKYALVKETVYNGNEHARLFLKNKLGVRKINDKDKIKNILEDYNCHYNASLNEHIEHIEFFINFYQNNKNDIEFFKNSNFIRVSEDEGYKKPDKIYIDNPFEKTGMKVLFKDNKSFFSLHEVYHKLEKDRKKVFLEFLTQLGARKELIIQKISDLALRTFYIGEEFEERIKLKKKRENKNSEFTDYIFEDNQKIFKTENIEISLLIWNTIKNLKEEKVEAYFRFNKNKDPNRDLTADSTLLCQLKTKAWIPDKDGKFYKPQNISKEQLHLLFHFQVDNIWLEAIELGKNIKVNEEDYKEKEKIISSLTGGHDIKDIEKLKDVDPDEFKRFLAQQKQFDLFGAIENLEGEAEGRVREVDPSIVTEEKKYLEQAQKELEKLLSQSTLETKKYISTRKVKVGRKEAKFFLEQQYNGHCQICGFTFLRRKNPKQGIREYFELFDFLSEKTSGQKVNFVQAGSSLCLCSQCHSMMKYASFQAQISETLNHINISKISFEDFISEISVYVDDESIPNDYGVVEMDMYKIPIELNQEKDKFIFYTEEHFLHLFVMLRSGRNDNE